MSIFHHLRLHHILDVIWVEPVSLGPWLTSHATCDRGPLRQPLTKWLGESASYDNWTRTVLSSHDYKFPVPPALLESIAQKQAELAYELAESS